METFDEIDLNHLLVAVQERLERQRTQCTLGELLELYNGKNPYKDLEKKILKMLA